MNKVIASKYENYATTKSVIGSKSFELQVSDLQKQVLMLTKQLQDFNLPACNCSCSQPRTKQKSFIVAFAKSR